MGMCSSFKSYVHVKTLELLISVIDFFDRLLIVLVVACGVRTVSLFLSVKPKKAGNIFEGAVMYNSYFNNSASGILKIAANVAGFEVIRDAFVHNAAFNLDVETSIELVNSGVLDGCWDIEGLLFELSVWCKRQSEIEGLITAIILRVGVMEYAQVIKKLNYAPLENGSLAVHNVLRIMRENGCNFCGGIPVAPETFIYPNHSHGLISDLIEWGVRIERLSPAYNGRLTDVSYIHAEIDEGERRIAERDAANIVQALSDEGLMQIKDTPKPKRKM